MMKDVICGLISLINCPSEIAAFGAGLCLERAPPGSQSLAGGCIPSPHSGLSMGLTDRRRLQLCYCTLDAPRIGGAGQQAVSLLEGGGTKRAGPKATTQGNPAQIDARWGPGSTGQYARKPQVEGKPGVAYCTAWTNVAHVSYSGGVRDWMNGWMEEWMIARHRPIQPSSHPFIPPSPGRQGACRR